MTWTLSAFADEAGSGADDQVAALQRAGIKHVDLRKAEGQNVVTLPIDIAEQVKQKLDAGGITVTMFGSPLGKIDIADDMQGELDKLDHLGKLADLFGCRAVRMFSYYNKHNAPRAKWQSESFDRMRRLRDRAGELGLVLYHENEKGIFGDRCPEIELMAAELRDGDAFRLIFDFDNFNQSGDDVWDNWQKLRDVTDAFHLKDSDTNNQHVPVGQGNGQVRRILADAAERGWSGPMSLEPHLKRSQAVLDTNPHGKAHQTYVDMSPADTFQVAAEAAIELIGQIRGVRV
jgi:sugar phosphate isomerase/epimerase